MIYILINLVCTVFLAGVIAVTHYITYRSFDVISTDQFSTFHKTYTRKVGHIVFIPMWIELGTSLIILWNINQFTFPIYLTFNQGLVFIIWGITFLFIVPHHHKLSDGFDKNKHYELMKYNRIRTVLWLLKALSISFYVFVI